MISPDLFLHEAHSDLVIQGIRVPIENIVTSSRGTMYFGHGTNSDLGAQIGRGLTVNILGSEEIFLPTSHCLDVFSFAKDVITDEASSKVDSCPIVCDMLVVEANLFKNFTRNVPDWVGTCQRGGLVLYDSQYVNRTFTGGSMPDINYFFDEMHHEMLHTYIDGLFPRLMLPLPILEGIIEAIARRNTTSMEQLRQQIKTFIERDGNFSINELEKGFWNYGSQRPDSHPAYQFSRSVVQKIADEINRWTFPEFNKPFEGIFALMSQYNDGRYAINQISFLDFIQYMSGIDLNRIELELLAG